MAKIDLAGLQRPASEAQAFSAIGSAGALSVTVRRLLPVEQIALFTYADEVATELQANPVLVGGEVVHAPASVCQFAVAIDMAQRAAESDRYSVRELIQLMVDPAYLGCMQEAFGFVLGADLAKDAVEGEGIPLAQKKRRSSSSARA